MKGGFHVDKSRFKSSYDLEMNRDGFPWESVPIQDMSDDCETCYNYYLDAPAFCEGGKCRKFGCSCGYGFTCWDYMKR